MSRVVRIIVPGLPFTSRNGESVGQGLAYQGQFAKGEGMVRPGYQLVRMRWTSALVPGYESARMTEFMNQMNPSAGNNCKRPVKDICFSKSPVNFTLKVFPFPFPI